MEELERAPERHRNITGSSFLAALVQTASLPGLASSVLDELTPGNEPVTVMAILAVLVALVIGPRTSYLVFIVPLLLVGGGFVVATTVRTVGRGVSLLIPRRPARARPAKRRKS
mgnify:CR=1 FL=1